ncbi:DDB1- and CUL4-associated factor 4 isoform X2 [Sagmatias obliquidens]|uniref:DDB1- and CUL4-associated factor 4 isoform X2 n=1 Tax=Sagmatias obliquidens TaxID=3371155 RepID=UPI000F43E8E4|nr:DDB1- and CUL4-associated factor 4 isoform X2 [Lagenorhynchus obliquidens]
MHKSRGQSRRHGRRSHRHNPWFRQHGSNERNNTRVQQSPQGSSHSDDEAPSTSSSTTGSSSVPDLPGYYFDPEKKRYFRLLPGHNNCNPLTKESIRQKEMESKRLQLLEEEDKQGKKTARLGFNASSLLQKSKLGFLNVTSYCRLAHELRVSCMQRKKVQIQSSDPSALASDRFNLILADTNSDRLFTVNDVKVGGSKYGIINLRGLKTPTLRVHMHENLYFTNRKVNAVSWASLNHLDSHILLCLMGIAETPGCATLLPASLFVSSHPGDRPGMLCSFRIPGAWSCAWSLNIQANNCFSTGLSRRVLVTSVVTGHRQSFGTSSDVLAQQFAVMWARTATRESGASMMPSCSEPYPPHTPLPRPTFPVWPSLLGSGASGERQGCSWPSDRTFTASPTANSAGCSLESRGCDSGEHSHWYCTSGEEPLPLFCTISMELWLFSPTLISQTVETTDYSEYLPSKQMRTVAQTGCQKCPQINTWCPPTRAPRDQVSPTYLSALDLPWSKSSMLPPLKTTAG